MARSLISVTRRDHSSIRSADLSGVVDDAHRYQDKSFKSKRRRESYRTFSSLFVLVPSASSRGLSPCSPITPRSKHVPIDISKFYTPVIGERHHHDTFNQADGQTSRLKRHIPIIIPDFAHPFAGELQQSPSSQSPHSFIGLGLRDIVEHLETEAQTDACERCPTIRTSRSSTIVPDSIMNNSETSLQSFGQNGESSVGGSSQQTITPGHTGVGISPNMPQQNQAAPNLSGLVCNVHRTSGDEPRALVGAATTILGDKLYVFGGRIHSRTKPKLTSDLYELDLIRRRWTKLETTGDIPPPRYFHSVCALGDSKLVCYGGMSPTPREPTSANSASAADPQPEVIVMSDVHVLHVPTKRWTLIASQDTPQGRYAHCATILPSSGVFTSATAPYSAIQHNPSSTDPHSGTLGTQLDGTAGAEMVVVGGQDSANTYIEQVSVFNLRSLKWTATTSWDRKCGAYKSMVAPLTGISVNSIGKGPIPPEEEAEQQQDTGTSMLIYSNYNFLDVKLELQIRLPDGTLMERPISGSVSPPGLRFPNGGVIDNHFVVSGTYLTSSKHEYALWALDLRTLTWGRIDTNGTVFSQGSWNRGVLWNRRNTYVILGHRKRNLVDDYNHRRINFSHVCFVELEAFGLYDNPRKSMPTSGYRSMSAPAIPASLQTNLLSQTAGGRPYSSAAQRLGEAALELNELADMDLIAVGGERIPCNSHIISRRWGPYFNQLLQSSVPGHDSHSISDAATLRPNMVSQASRNSSITITSTTGGASMQSGGSTLVGGQSDTASEMARSGSAATTRPPDPSITISVPASSRPRSLYLPHTAQTIQLLLHYLYTSSLPPVGGTLCTPHVLCSLLQMARPYQIDGLLEATVGRLHEVLDGRNAAAVFNAAAMAAGGGRGLGQGTGGTLETLERLQSSFSSDEPNGINGVAGRGPSLRVNTNVNGIIHEEDSSSTATSASTGASFTDTESSNADAAGDNHARRNKHSRDTAVWTGDLSAVIGLQKRGLRGLMEGRRLRVRAQTMNQGGAVEV